MKSFLLNVKVFKGKPLAIDTKKGCRMIFPSSLGLPKSWYGGRVGALAEIEPGVCLCLERDTMKPIDVYVSDVEKLEYIALKEVAKVKGHTFPAAIKKEDLLALLGIESKQEGGGEKDA